VQCLSELQTNGDAMIKFMDDFLTGFRLPMSGFGLIWKEPRLRRYAAVPFIINSLLFLLMFYFLYAYRVEVVELVWERPENQMMLKVLWYMLAVFMFALVAVLSYFMFTPVGCLISSPFNEFLSARAELLLDPMKKDAEIPFSIKDLGRSLVAELIKLGIMLGIMLVVLLLNLMPAIGSLISMLAGFFAAALFLTLEYMDYPLSHNAYNFREKLNAVVYNMGWSLGFGSGAALLLLIPLLNLFCIPACVVGAVRLYIMLRREGGMPQAAAAERESDIVYDDGENV